MRILVISDDPDSAGELAEQVSQSGGEYSVNIASWPTYSPALLGDADLLLIHVHNVVSRNRIIKLREISKIPILLLSSIGEEEFLACLYAAGVDDYLALPISYPLLFAKLRVWQRWVVRLATVLYH
jgi:two-component system OmpR family response regulator